jgi:cytidylate kinase
MKADLSIRAARRQKEILQKGELIELEKIKHNLEERDRMDSSRAESPLLKAQDAIEIDTSLLEFDHQVDQIVSLAKEKLS